MSEGSTGIMVDDGEHDPVALAQAYYEQAKKNIEEDQTKPFSIDAIDVEAVEAYHQALETHEGEAIHSFLQSKDIRYGFMKMIEILLTVVDIFAFAERNLFDASQESPNEGCTYHLQVLMSMLRVFVACMKNVFFLFDLTVVLSCLLVLQATMQRSVLVSMQ
jgi:hypothetical protein